MRLYPLVNFIFWMLDIAILLRVLISWIQPDPYNPIVRVIYDITEPILAPLRRYIPPLGGFDLTPMVALILLDLLERVILSLLF